MNAIASSPAETLLRHTLDFCTECVNRQDFVAALEALGRALSLAPRDAAILNQRGRLLLFLEEFEAAKLDFIEAIAIDAESAPAHSGLARYHLAQGQLEEAEKSARRALSMDLVDEDAIEALMALRGQPRSASTEAASTDLDEREAGLRLNEFPTVQLCPEPRLQPPPESARPLTKFPESKLAHQYLDGLEGLEIGGSAHNPFGLKTKNVDYIADLDTIFKKEEVRMCGEALKVDIVSRGDELPVPDESQDFVISSHVIEHFFDPIKAVKEWLRVIRPGGYVFIIAPHKERTFDRERARTPLAELLDRHTGKIPKPAQDTHEHYSVWITEDFLELCAHLKWKVVASQDADDKVGNGFTILIQKPVAAPPQLTAPPVAQDLSQTARKWLAKAYRCLFEQAPDDAALLVHLGQCSSALKEWGTAAQFFARALALDPENQQARESLAKINTPENGAFRIPNQPQG